MIIKNIAFSVFIILFFGTTTIVAQDDKVQQVQPTIMVVPWTSQSENVMDKIDNDFTYRAVLNTIKNAFEHRGFTTRDFITAYNNAKVDRTLKWDKISNIFQELANNTPCDIYIKADIQLLTSGRENIVNILLEAVNNYTNESLASKFFSRTNYSSNIALIAKSALEQENKLQAYLDLLNQQFMDIRKNGRIVTVVFSVGEESEVDYDAEIGDDYLVDIMLEWLNDNAYQNYLKEGNIDATGFNIELKVPLRNEAGNNYSLNNLARKIRKQLKFLGLQTEFGSEFDVSRPQIKGSNIYITINTQ